MVTNLINEKDRMFSFLKKGFFPNSIIFTKLESYLKTLLDRKCFVIVSPTVYRAKSESLKEILTFEEEDIFFLSGEPKEDQFLKCKQTILSKKERYSFILALGGGSVIDLAKAVKNEAGLELIAVPTTPGTGSEITPFSVITTEQKEKRIINSHKLLPEVVILDSSLLRTIPEESLKYMIVDILGHNIEGIFSKFSNPLSDILAANSLKILFTEIIGNEQFNEDFLTKIQIAGLLAGFAQGMAYTGLAHAFAHSFGPKYEIGHGKILSIFLQDVVRLNLENSTAGEKLEKLGLPRKEIFSEEIKKLFTKLKIPEEKIKVGKDFDLITSINQVKKDVCILTNPYQPTEKQVEKVIRAHIILPL